MLIASTEPFVGESDSYLVAFLRKYFFILANFTDGRKKIVLFVLLSRHILVSIHYCQWQKILSTNLSQEFSEQLASSCSFSQTQMTAFRAIVAILHSGLFLATHSRFVNFVIRVFCTQFMIPVKINLCQFNCSKKTRRGK